MNYLVLGAGLQGRIVGYDIFEQDPDANITFADCCNDNLGIARTRVEDYSDRANFVEIDFLHQEESVELMRESDILIICLPHAADVTTAVFEAMIEVGNKKAIISDYWYFELIKSFDDRLREAGGLCVPGLGIAPGFANICVGQLAEEFDQIEEARIYVGGFPVERGVMPFDYMELYNLNAMLDMYTTDVTVIENGEYATRPPLEVAEHILIPGHGEFEAYYTNGLNSLGDNMLAKGITKCDELTLRHPGHVELMQQIKDYGFLDMEEIEIQGVKIKPRDFTEQIFQKLWVNEPHIPDMTYLYVLGKGYVDGRFTKKAYELKTYDDRERGITSMELATAYPISIAAMMVANGATDLRGVIDPENIFIGENFETMVDELAKRNVNVYEYNY